MKKNLTKLIPYILKQLWPGLKFSCCIIAIALFQITVNAQPGKDIKISGKVNSTLGEPLIGVTVGVKNSSIKTTTDVNGNFTLTAPDNAVLEISYVGFKKQELSVSGRTELPISLEADANIMTDVVVVGYSSQKKASISGAVATVDMGDVSKTRIPDVAQALQGQVAGVFVAANTGAPGDGIKIRIRGEGTLGNNEVLYILDGVPTRDIFLPECNGCKIYDCFKRCRSFSYLWFKGRWWRSGHYYQQRAKRKNEY